MRFYRGLRKRGKPGKVALVAVMRKLLLHVNAVARRIPSRHRYLDRGCSSPRAHAWPQLDTCPAKVDTFGRKVDTSGQELDTSSKKLDSLA